MFNKTTALPVFKERTRIINKHNGILGVEVSVHRYQFTVVRKNLKSFFR